ncbi:MAG: PLP-dependent aminotransferase family protein [Clostridia bacterium]|nr:PLP-dependent aminotransferase family protein [Clostridia bacterium]
MEYRFSEKFASLKPSAVREILKSDAGKNNIPFSAGNPAAESFPSDFVRRAAEQILESRPVEALQYGISEGWGPLRETLKAWCAERCGIDMTKNEVIVVSGAQQGIELTAQVICNEGDTVIAEDPSFIGALNAFRASGLKLTGIPLDSDGADPEALDRALANDPKAKLIYLIPTFQNPTGITASAERRAALYAVAKKHDAIILEDDPYRETRFDGADVPTIKSMDEDGRVVYCGSFSKVLSAGMRVGFVAAAPELIAKITVGKQCADVHTNMLAQMIVDSFVNAGNIEAHIARIRRIYKRKYALMAEGAAKHFPASAKLTRPQGGLFVWCSLPAGADALEVTARAKAKGVSVVPGLAFSVKEGENVPFIRLNYSTPSDEQIERGMAILGGVLREYEAELSAER